MRIISYVRDYTRGFSRSAIISVAFGWSDWYRFLYGRPNFYNLQKASVILIDAFFCIDFFYVLKRLKFNRKFILFILINILHHLYPQLLHLNWLLAVLLNNPNAAAPATLAVVEIFLILVLLHVGHLGIIGCGRSFFYFNYITFTTIFTN